MNKRTILGLAIVAAGFAAKGADDGPYADGTGPALTDWTYPLGIPQFDSDLGTLTGISYTITGSIHGDQQSEHIGAGAAALVLTFAGQFNFRYTSLVPIDTLTVSKVNNFAATAFDGAINFAGSSGVSFLNISVGDADSGTIPAIDWGIWQNSSPGLVPIELFVHGSSATTGSGNKVDSVNQDATGIVEVTYHYTPAGGEVPEPGTYVGAAGLLGIGALAYRRARKARA